MAGRNAKAPTGQPNWLVYANQGAIRNQPVDDRLYRVLQYAAQAAGIDQVRVFSGGQPSRGGPFRNIRGRRIGSVRHDAGNGADINLIVGGRKLDFRNQNDRRRFQAFVSAARAAGATGIGAGTDYMGPTSLHVDLGTPAVWGGGGRSINAPAWLVEAYNARPGQFEAMAYAAENTSPAAAATQATISTPQARRGVKTTDEMFDPAMPVFAGSPTGADLVDSRSLRNVSAFSLPGSTSRTMFGASPMGMVPPSGPGAPDRDVIVAALEGRRIMDTLPGIPPAPVNTAQENELRLGSLPMDMNPGWPEPPAMAQGGPNTGVPVSGPPPMPGQPEGAPGAPVPRRRPQQQQTMAAPWGMGIGYQGPPGPWSLINDYTPVSMFYEHVTRPGQPPVMFGPQAGSRRGLLAGLFGLGA